MDFTLAIAYWNVSNIFLFRWYFCLHVWSLWILYTIVTFLWYYLLGKKKKAGVMRILRYLGYSTSHGNMLERSLNKRMAHQLILLYNSNSWIFACQPADIITNISLLQKNCTVFSSILIFQKDWILAWEIPKYTHGAPADSIIQLK